MNLHELNGKGIALVLMRKDEVGDDDWAVMEGRAVVRGEELYLERAAGQPLFPVPSDAIERIRPVDEDLKDILLGAELCIPLTVGTADEDVDPDTLVELGYVWPME
jgi:hypothetical protein